MPHRGSLIFLSVVLVLLIPALVPMAWPFFTSFLLAGVAAIVIHPLKEWLNAKTDRPALSTFAITLATVLLLGGLVGMTGMTLTRELTAAYNALSKRSLEEGGWPSMVTSTSDRVIDAVANRIPIDKEAIRTEIIERMKDASQYLLSKIGVAVGGVTSMIGTFLMMTVFLYFLLRHGKAWVERLVELTPLDERTSGSILLTVRDSVIANVLGVLAVAVGQAIALIIGFWIVSVRSPVLWGSVGGLASVIPLVGPPMVWVPVALGYLIVGAYWKALFLALWGALLVGSIDNIVRPLVVGARDKQHPMVIALAAIGGTFAFGPIGILMGPLAISLVAAVLKEMRRLMASYTHTTVEAAPTAVRALSDRA